jgi:hypothetical protein
MEDEIIANVVVRRYCVGGLEEDDYFHNYESREKQTFKWRASQITRINCPKYFSDYKMKYFTNLTSLHLGDNRIITDNGIKGLTKLTSLKLSVNDNITREMVTTLRDRGVAIS